MKSNIWLYISLWFSCFATPALFAGVPNQASSMQLRIPQSAEEAEFLLEASLLALKNGQHALGAEGLQSLVKFDGLTMSGKVNLYWLMAQTYRVMQDKSHYEEALYAFVVLAPLVADADKEIAGRLEFARAFLLTQKLQQNPTMGSLNSAPLIIERLDDLKEALSQMSCGEKSQGFYTVSRVAVSNSAHNAILTATCSIGHEQKVWHVEIASR